MLTIDVFLINLILNVHLRDVDRNRSVDLKKSDQIYIYSVFAKGFLDYTTAKNGEIVHVNITDKKPRPYFIKEINEKGGLFIGLDDISVEIKKNQPMLDVSWANSRLTTHAFNGDVNQVFYLIGVNYKHFKIKVDDMCLEFDVETSDIHKLACKNNNERTNDLFYIEYENGNEENILENLSEEYRNNICDQNDNSYNGKKYEKINSRYNDQEFKQKKNFKSRRNTYEYSNFSNEKQKNGQNDQSYNSRYLDKSLNDDNRKYEQNSGYNCNRNSDTSSKYYDNNNTMYFDKKSDNANKQNYFNDITDKRSNDSFYNKNNYEEKDSLQVWKNKIEKNILCLAEKIKERDDNDLQNMKHLEINYRNKNHQRQDPEKSIIGLRFEYKYHDDKYPSLICNTDQNHNEFERENRFYNDLEDSNYEKKEIKKCDDSDCNVDNCKEVQNKLNFRDETEKNELIDSNLISTGDLLQLYRKDANRIENLCYKTPETLFYKNKALSIC
ncbi:hypothetical protein GVAV_003195 [Gurleya vavrai]